MVTGAFNEYFPSLFPQEELSDSDINKVLGGAMRRGDTLVSRCVLEIYHLKGKASFGHQRRHPILIGAEYW